MSTDATTETTAAATVVPTQINENGSSVEVGFTADDPLGPSQQGEEDAGGLIAGKFKSQDDLIKAYKELESKMGQPKGDEEQQPDTPPEVDPNAPKVAAIETTDEARETLQEKGLDINRFTAEYETTGQLSEESYVALEAKGINRDMVNAYIAGQKVLVDSQIMDIKNSVGGEAEYQKISTWAHANLSDAEKQAFNNILATNDIPTIKMAAAGLKARYDGIMGKNPQVVVGGSSAAGNDGVERFESMAQVVSAMRDPRYDSDPAYRQKIERKVANSGSL